MTFTHALSTNNYGPAKFIVATSAANGTHTTLATAMAAASAGDTIFLRDSVTENVTITPGVNIVGWSGSSANMPSITGKLTMTAAGTSTISGITLITNSDNFLAVTGSADSIVRLKNCYLNCLNATGISYTSSGTNSTIQVNECSGNIATTGITLIVATGAGSVGFHSCDIHNTGGSTTASSTSACQITAVACDFNFVFATSSTGNVNFFSTNILPLSNTTCITTAGTGILNFVTNSFLSSGTASAISIGTGTTLTAQSSTIDSSNTNAITGAGTLIHSGLSYNSSATINATTTTNAKFGRTGTWTPGISFGGGTTGITYTTQVGNYTMVGNVVFIDCQLILSNKGSSTGQALLTGLPITPTASSVFGIAIGRWGNITLTASYNAVGVYSNGANNNMILVQSGTALTSADLTNTAFANNSFVQFSGVYIVA